MPRKPGIYRNVKGSEIDALIVNLRDGTTAIERYTVPVTFSGDKVAALSYLDKRYSNTKIKVVKIKRMKETEKSYFLSIEDFYKVAKEI